ncbi:putative RNA-directed DNA polymerase [Helianthus annuus]|nr:putative RNA-directed DNA polymerase [Helianthus annuus]
MVHLPSCSCQAAKDYNDFSTLIKLMQFLMGLDDVYQPVRTNILTREPFPSVKVAFSIISREESHRMASSGSKGQNVSFVSKSGQTFDSRKRIVRGPNPNLKCSHCNMIGYTVDRCFEIIGYPPGVRRRPGGQFAKSNVSSNNNSNNNKSSVTVGSSNSVSASMPFTSEQISKLLNFVGEKSGGKQSKSNMGGESSVTCGFTVGFVSCSSSNVFGYEYNWIVDSGANQHMVKSDRDMFDWVDVSDFDLKVGHPNGTNVKVFKIGKLKLIDGVILEDVFYVPEYSDLRSKKVLVTGSQDNGLYFVRKNGNSVNMCYNSFLKSSMWHSRLGHPSDQVLAVLKGNLDIKTIDHGPCEICHKAKQVRVPFPLSEHKTKEIGDIAHLDLWGPYKVSSYEGFRYFLTVVDDYSRSVWCYLLKNKMEVSENLTSFYELILTQFKKKVKIFRSDNGTEFVNNQMNIFF